MVIKYFKPFLRKIIGTKILFLTRKQILKTLCTLTCCHWVGLWHTTGRLLLSLLTGRHPQGYGNEWCELNYGARNQTSTLSTECPIAPSLVVSLLISNKATTKINVAPAVLGPIAILHTCMIHIIYPTRIKTTVYKNYQKCPKTELVWKSKHR